VENLARHRDSIPGPCSPTSPGVVKKITVVPAMCRLEVYVDMSKNAGSGLRCFGMRRGVLGSWPPTFRESKISLPPSRGKQYPEGNMVKSCKCELYRLRF
jgi:hypothetical protein